MIAHYDKNNGLEWFGKHQQKYEITDDHKYLFDTINSTVPGKSFDTEGILEIADSLNIADDNLKKFLQSEKYGKKDLANFTKFLKEQNKGLTGFKSGLKEVGKSLKSFGINLGLDLAASAITSLVSMGIDKLMSIESDAAEKAQQAYDASAEQVEKNKETETSIFSSASELTKLLENEDWGLESAQRASDIYSQMADTLEETGNASEERIAQLREEAEQMRENIGLSKEEREAKAEQARIDAMKDAGWNDTKETNSSKTALVGARENFWKSGVADYFSSVWNWSRHGITRNSADGVHVKQLAGDILT